VASRMGRAGVERTLKRELRTLRGSGGLAFGGGNGGEFQISNFRFRNRIKIKSKIKIRIRIKIRIWTWVNGNVEGAGVNDE